MVNQDRDFQYFLDNYNDFFKKYGHSFLVIKNCEVIGTYNDFSQAYHDTLKKEKLGDFIIQECNGDESAYTCYVASNEIRVI